MTESADGQQGLFTDWCGLARVDLLDGNYGFARAQTNVEPSYEEESMFCEFEDNPVPEEVYIHEFLHTFENFEEYMLDCDGNPDEAEDNGYECLTSFGANGFYEYYRDLLNGNVLHKKRGKNVGMDEKLWRTEALLMDIAKGRVETDLR